MNMKRYLRLGLFLILAVNVAGCSNGKAAAGVSKEPVSMVHKGSHFEVVLDYTAGTSHYEMGKAYGAAILEAVPDYESLFDSYLADMTRDNQDLDFLLQRVKDIKPQMEQDYADEIEGIASNFSGGADSIRGDGKLSAEELFLINLFPDVARGTQCSAVSVYGQRSETGETITARILDWVNGTKNQLSRMHAVVTYKNDNKSIVTIGYLGFMGTVSGFNDDKVFGAILDAGTGAAYSSSSKYSYPMDLRYALEHYQTMDEVAAYLTSPDREYAFSHLIFMSDPTESKVLENNVSGQANSLRDVRTEESEFNGKIVWGISDSIGSVNSFLLKGNFNNHSLNLFNTARYESMKDALESKGEEVTVDELKSVASYYGGEAPGEQTNGDLYNLGTQQIILFEPGELKLEVFFRPIDNVLPAVPQFEEIDVDLD